MDSPAWHKRLRWGIYAGGIIPILLGSFGLMAWINGDAVRRAALGVITMKTNMAIAQILAGSALLLITSPRPGGGPRRKLGMVAAAVTLGIGSLTLAQYVLGINLGIDQLLAVEPSGAPATTSPNRMGVPGCSSLTVIGAGLLALGLGLPRLSPALGVAACIINLVPAVGYLCGINAFYSRPGVTGIAWSTVTGFLCLGTGLTLASPGRGPIGVLLRDDPGGSLFRKQLPVVCIIPLALGFLISLGQHRHWYTSDSAIGLIIILLVVIFGALLWRNAVQISRSAAELRKQQEWFRVTLRSIGDGVIACDTDGQVTFINPVAEAITGWCSTEALRQPVRRIFPLINEDTGQPTEDPVARVLQDKLPVALSNHTALTSRTGEAVPIADSAAPIVDGAGLIQGVVLVFHEVTKKRHAERLIQSTALFPEESPFPIMRAAADGSLLYANSASEPLLEEWQTRAVGRAPSFVQRAVRGALESGQNRELEIACNERDLALVLVPIHGRDYVNVYGCDVTDRKKSELALRESEARFRLLAEVSSRLLGAEDPQRLVEELCQKVMRHLRCDCFLNYLVDEATGRLRLNACGGLAADQADSLHWLESGAAVCGLVAREGKRIIVDKVQASTEPRTALVRSFGVRAYCCHPFYGRERVIGTLSFGTKTRDRFSSEEVELMQSVANQVAVAIQRLQAQGELQRARDALAQSNQELEAKVRERTAKLRETVADLEQFSYSIAHDLRAPLRAMSSFSSILLEEHAARLDADGLNYLRRITSAAKRMDDLIRDVLTYSCVVRADAVLTPVDLDHLVHEVIEQYPQFTLDRAEIVVARPLLPVLGNPALLTQCISNLLGNATKFVAAGVRPHVRVWTELYAGCVRLSVRDNGIGIEPDHLERIWRIFERIHDQRHYEGTGIGLSVVKRAVERMGGRVGAESTPGQGSVFWLELTPATEPVARKKSVTADLAPL